MSKHDVQGFATVFGQLEDGNTWMPNALPTKPAENVFHSRQIHAWALWEAEAGSDPTYIKGIAYHEINIKKPGLYLPHGGIPAPKQMGGDLEFDDTQTWECKVVWGTTLVELEHKWGSGGTLAGGWFGPFAYQLQEYAVADGFKDMFWRAEGWGFLAGSHIEMFVSQNELTHKQEFKGTAFIVPGKKPLQYKKPPQP